MFILERNNKTANIYHIEFCTVTAGSGQLGWIVDFSDICTLLPAPEETAL